MPPSEGVSLTGTAWRPGDPVGDRRFVGIGPLTLESGAVLPDVRIAYESWGTYRGDNAVLVLHALTGDSHVAGPAGRGHPSPGWWDPLVGPGRALDPDRHFVLAADILGGCQGSTGPGDDAPDGERWGTRFPDLTVRDQVAAEIALADALGIDAWRAVVGGSAGGMRALEWAIHAPWRVQRLLLLATSAAASADQIGLSTTQQAAIALDPVGGLDVARRIAHLSYRSAAELEARFGRDRGSDGRFAVESYLEHHGHKLARRFDPDAYVTLTRAMDSHDVGRGRGGTRAALGGITARTIVAGIDSDRLYPLHQQAELADLIPTSGDLRVVTSEHGHDGFLVETDQIAALVRQVVD